MNIKEEFLENMQELLVTSIPVEYVQNVVDAATITLSKYNLSIIETNIVKYDGCDEQIMKRFFVAKAVEGLSPNSLKCYNSILLSYFKSINKHIKEITTDDIRLYLAYKKMNKASDNYLNHIRRILSTFYGWCLEENIVQYNPTLRIKGIRRTKKLKKPLSDEEMELLRVTAKDFRERAVIEFLFSTGCRVSEMVSVNVEDIDFDNGEVDVFGKGKKYRTVYLSSRCKILLQEYLKERNAKSGPLFVSVFKPHNRLDKGCIEHMVRTIGRKAGIANVHPHRFRRTAATTALRRGMPIEQVQKMLGHESIATTTIYAQSTENDVKISHEKYIV